MTPDQAVINQAYAAIAQAFLTVVALAIAIGVPLYQRKQELNRLGDERRLQGRGLEAAIMVYLHVFKASLAEFERKVAALESDRALMAAPTFPVPNELGIWIHYLHTIRNRKSYSVLDMIKEVLKCNDWKQDTISKRDATFMLETLQNELELALRNMKSLGEFCDPPDIGQRVRSLRVTTPVGPSLSRRSSSGSADLP